MFSPIFFLGNNGFFSKKLLLTKKKKNKATDKLQASSPNLFFPWEGSRKVEQSFCAKACTETEKRDFFYTFDAHLYHFFEQWDLNAVTKSVSLPWKENL